MRPHLRRPTITKTFLVVFVIALGLLLLTDFEVFKLRTSTPTNNIASESTTIQEEIVGETFHQIQIYVYDDLETNANDKVTPPNSECVKGFYGADYTIHHQLLGLNRTISFANQTTHYVRTTNAAEAHFFFAPVYAFCFPGWFAQRQESMAKFARGLIAKHPDIWNRNNGTDHIWVFTHDFGACFTMQPRNADMVLPEVKKGIVFQYYADRKYPNCFRTGRDVVIPQLLDEELIRISTEVQVLGRDRKYLAYFKGQVKDAVFEGSDVYSHRTRSRIYDKYASDPDFKIIATDKRTGDYPKQKREYVNDMLNSKFCLCPLGYSTWSPRLYESILFGCIPVIIADDSMHAFEKRLDWTTFSVRVPENQVLRLKEILSAYSEEDVARMQQQLVKVRYNFIYQRHLGIDDYEANHNNNGTSTSTSTSGGDLRVLDFILDELVSNNRHLLR